jgi:hypothetical protein
MRHLACGTRLLVRLGHRRRRHLPRRRRLLLRLLLRRVDVHIVIILRHSAARLQRLSDQARRVADRHRRRWRLLDRLVVADVLIVLRIRRLSEAGCSGCCVARCHRGRLAAQLSHVSAAAQLLAAQRLDALAALLRRGRVSETRTVPDLP